MREIKFRIWFKTFESWLRNDEYRILYNGTVEYIKSSPFFMDEREAIIQQYTGIKDKNGVEIYEGDILFYSRLNYEVFWNDYKWDARCPYYNKYHWPLFGEEFKTKTKNSILVGNIFENQELLKNEI